MESGSQVVNVTMEKYSFCGYDCQIVNCKIGSFCSIADNVKIGGARHPLEWVSTSPVFYKGRDSVKKKFSTFNREEDKFTNVGNDVWIGANAIIIQGVIIGNGAIIGAGAVVTHNVGDYEIVAGNPARVIRKRFSEDIIKEFIDLKWWEMREDVLMEAAAYIREPRLFLEFLKSNNNMRINNLQRGGVKHDIVIALAA